MPSLRTSYEDCLYGLAGYLGVLFQEGFQSRLSCYSCSHLYWRYHGILRGVFFSSSFPSICNPVGYERLVLVCCHIPYRPRNPCHSLLPSIPQQLPEIPSGVCSPASPPDHPQKDLSKLGFSPCSTQLSTEPIADTGVPRLLARSALTASASRRR